MSNAVRKLSKTAITEAVFKNLPHTLPCSSKEVFSMWWHNKLRSGSMRLTDSGDAAFTLADIEGWSFDLDLQPKINYYEHLKFLSEGIECPYFIYRDFENKKARIKVYDSKVAMLIGLHGSISGYLEYKQRLKPKRKLKEKNYGR
jgi:hypothetical protein